jgi:hypothetical protein
MENYSRIEKLLLSFLYCAAEAVYFSTEDDSIAEVAEVFMHTAPRASWNLSTRFWYSR